MLNPTVHMNGDSRETLLAQYFDAISAVQMAIEKLPQINARNFYTQGDTATSQAMAEINAMRQQLSAMHSELEAVAINIADGE